MCVRQKSLMQQDLGGDGDNCSTCTSKWSSGSSSLCSVPDVSLYPSDCKVKADRSPYDQPLTKQRGPKPSGRKKGNKGPGDKKRANHPHLKSLPVRHLEHSEPSIQSEGLTYIRRLECQVWDLQQQLAEARPENKLLKRIQHRHTVALQHSQDQQDSMSQILAKHKNETKSLRKLLHQTSACRDNYARQLQASKNKLHSVQTAHQHQSLLQREELSKKLDKASAELQEKGRRIQHLEKNLALCQASFKQQLAAEQRKAKKAMETVCFLQKTIDQLSREKQGNVPANVALEKNKQEDETRTDHSVLLEENTSEDSFKKSSRHHTQDDRAKESEAPGEKQETNVACALETSLDGAKNKMSFKKFDTNTRSDHLLRPSTKDLLSATQTRANVTALRAHDGGDSGCLSTRRKRLKKM